MAANNMGKVSHVRLKTVKDCEVIVMDGVRYRDITELLFEESKYKKTYPTDAEWRKISGYENKNRERRSITIDKDWSTKAVPNTVMTEDKKKAVALLNKGLSYREVAEHLDIPLGTLAGWSTFFKRDRLITQEQKRTRRDGLSEHDHEVITLNSKGNAPAVIAKKLNTSVQEIYTTQKRLRRWGLIY